jgi:hypothetical protein
MNTIAHTYFFILLFGFLSVNLSAQHKIPEDFCITNNELKLYNLINDYRKANNKDEIPLSKSLSYVAKLHVNDLLINRPDTAECNLHSWSDKGDWTQCCYGRDIFNNTCMTSKPKELTSYPASGYEIAFWESVDAEPEIVLDLWTSANASNDLILNQDIWEEKDWKALGVGMLKGYAVVWFGTEADLIEGVKICFEEKTTQSLLDRVRLHKKKDAKTKEVFHLIIASHKDRESAQKEVNYYKSRGFRNPSIVTSGENFRVSLGNYPTYEEAVSAKKSLSERYSKAWILKQ